MMLDSHRPLLESDCSCENSQKLLELHGMMKRLIRYVEAIPLHLSLPIVRFDDALGESWALPYQACQTIWVLCYSCHFKSALIRRRIFGKSL